MTDAWGRGCVLQGEYVTIARKVKDKSYCASIDKKDKPNWSSLVFYNSYLPDIAYPDIVVFLRALSAR